MDAKKKEREALLQAKEFAGEIATFGGKYSYLNGTEVVRDAYKLLGTIEAALAQPAQGEAVVKRDAIMAQAQVFASAWSLVGGPFDNGDALENAEHEKIELQRMVSKILTAAPQPPADTIAVPRSEWEAMKRDAEEWKQEHENLLAVRDADLAALSAKIGAHEGWQYVSKRLRRVCSLLDLGDSIPDGDKQLYDVMFSVLGMIARKIEEGRKQ